VLTVAGGSLRLVSSGGLPLVHFDPILTQDPIGSNGDDGHSFASFFDVGRHLPARPIEG
jgi:hypothetical protein